MNDAELKEYIDRAVQNALCEKKIQEKNTPRAFQPTLDKWFRNEKGYTPQSVMGKAFDGDGVRTYALWDRIRPIVTSILDCKTVRQINSSDHEFANEIADRICQVIYDCRNEYKERAKKMNIYKIGYIDGHDGLYKERIAFAESMEEGMDFLRKSYDGDFEHIFKNITENDKLIYEG